IEVSVQPTLLANSHPLASVNNEYNAVYVNGEAIGETMFYGPGAGSLPTATAVMSDVVVAIQNMRLGVSGHQLTEPLFEKEITPAEERISKFYLRLTAKDETGAFATISELFNQLDISFERILQTPSDENNLAEIILVTHTTSLNAFQQAMDKLDNLDVVESIKSHFRVEGDVEE